LLSLEIGANRPCRIGGRNGSEVGCRGAPSLDTTHRVLAAINYFDGCLSGRPGLQKKHIAIKLLAFCNNRDVRIEMYCLVYLLCLPQRSTPTRGGACSVSDGNGGQQTTPTCCVYQIKI